MLRQVGDTQADWRGHVIVCGLLGVGLPIVEELTLSGVPAVVIDDDPTPSLARMIAAWDVPLITGQARAEETLVSAGLAGAIAVICAQENDLSALETALLVRRLRAEVRVIAQLANPAVGRAVREAGVAVLDVAGLSAPSVVEVCLGEGVQELSLSGMRFLAARTTAPHAATLRELYGALAPVAVVPPTGDVLVCPGRDTMVRAGDEVTLIGTPDELAAVSVIDHPERIRRLAATASPGGNEAVVTAGPPGILGVLGGEDPDALPAGPSPAGRALRWLRDLAVSFARAADRRMALALGALLAVLVTATLVLHFTYRLAGPGHRISLLESVYFTVETVTTVGYGDYTFRGEPAWLIIFAVGLMITGALFVAVFFALLTNMLVSRRIEESLGLQKIVALRGHILVIGLGTIGLRVVRKLHDLGREVAVIEKDEHNRHLGQVRALRVPVMIADATLPEVLASARLAAASAVAVLTSDDLANLETGLAVRDQLGSRWREVPVVLRIFDPQLAHSVKETFGFRNVRSTAALAAPWFVGAALGLDVLSTFYAGDEPLLVARLTVTPGGGLHGLQMHELAARTRVLALRRAADRAVLEHPPRRATRFEPADEAYLIGPYDELLTVLRRDRPSPGHSPDEVTPQAPGPPDQAPNSADHAATPPGHLPDRPDHGARTSGRASGPSGPGELTRPDHG
jgi:Trk K+ transport system NAD-binding subunit